MKKVKITVLKTTDVYKRQEQIGFFARPVDLSQADYLLWGETEIPLH